MYHSLLPLLVLNAVFCGIDSRRFGGRIVGGQEADIKDFPYQLSLLSYGWHICGASIIAKSWALTAAQCVYKADPEEITLRAGSSLEGSEGSVHQAIQIIWHPNYSETLDYDYALIKVNKEFSVGTTGIDIINLAEEEPAEGELAVISGWGATEVNSSTVIQLQKVEIPIIERETCKDMYEGYDITDRMICAGLAEGGKGVCQGDSGGPLTVDNILVGIVSWGIGCANPESPGVFSNVIDQKDWIFETILQDERFSVKC